MTTTASIEAIQNSFPFPTITPYTGEKDYASIEKKTLLGFTVTNTAYLIITGVAFVHHINPGYLPIIPDPATAAKTSKLLLQHKDLLRMFQEIVNIDCALK